MIHNKAKQQQTELWCNSTMCKLIFHQLATKNLNVNAVRYSMGQKKNYTIHLFDRPKSGFVRAKKYLAGQISEWYNLTGDLLSVILSQEILTGIQTSLP